MSEDVDGAAVVGAALESEAVALARIVIPAADADVRARLRTLREPVHVFGESEAERRVRLRRALHALGRTGREDEAPASAGAANSGAASAGSRLRGQEWFSRGPAGLQQWRSEHATACINAAGTRIGKLREAFPRWKSGELDTAKLAEWTRVRSLATTCTSQLPAGRHLTCVASLVPDESVIVAGHEDGEVHVWAADRQHSAVLAAASTRCGARITSVAACPRASPHLFAATTRMHTAVLWRFIRGRDGDTNSGRCEECHVLKGHSAPVNRCAFDPLNGRSLVTTSDDFTFRLWDVDTGACIFSQDGHDPRACRAVWAVAFHPDASLLTTTDFSGIALTWDVRTGRCVWRQPLSHDGRCTCVDWAGDGVRFATGGEDGVVMVWDARRLAKGAHNPAASTGAANSRAPPGPLDLAPSCMLYGVAAHNDVVTAVRFAPPASLIPTSLVTTSLDRIVKIWDADTGAEMHKVLGHASGIRGFDFVHPHAQAASAAADTSATGAERFLGGWGVVTAARSSNWRLIEAVEGGSIIMRARAVTTANPEPAAAAATTISAPAEEGDATAATTSAEAPPVPPLSTAAAADSDSDDDMMVLRKKKQGATGRGT